MEIKINRSLIQSKSSTMDNSHSSSSQSGILFGSLFNRISLTNESNKMLDSSVGDYTNYLDNAMDEDNEPVDCLNEIEQDD